MRVEWLAEAASDLQSAVDWHAERAQGLGEEFLAEVEKAVDMIADSPRRWAPYLLDARRVVLRRFPYSIVYRFEEPRVVIVALAHQRRKPGYWKDRS